MWIRSHEQIIHQFQIMKEEIRFELKDTNDIEVTVNFIKIEKGQERIIRGETRRLPFLVLVLDEKAITFHYFSFLNRGILLTCQVAVFADFECRSLFRHD